MKNKEYPTDLRHLPIEEQRRIAHEMFDNIKRKYDQLLEDFPEIQEILSKEKH
jgi:hypothetical protein